MCPDRTNCRQGSLYVQDATSWGAWVQDPPDAEARLGESGRNTPVSDAGHLFADEHWPMEHFGQLGQRSAQVLQYCTGTEVVP